MKRGLGILLLLAARCASADDMVAPFDACPNGVATTVEGLDNALFWYGSLEQFCFDDNACSSGIHWTIDNVTGPGAPWQGYSYLVFGATEEDTVVAHVDLNRCIALFEWSHYGVGADEIYNQSFE